MAKRIPGISSEWSEYLICLVLHMTLPLLPLVLEALLSKTNIPTSQTLTITTAIYSMSIGLSSKNKAMFGLCLLIGVSFSAVFGIVSASTTMLPTLVSGINYASMGAIGAVFLIHALERYNRHVADCSPFLEFN